MGIMITGIAVISILTTLTVEALKKTFNEAGIKYSSNIMAAVVAVILSVTVSAGYIIFNDIEWSAQTVITIIAMAFLSFLGATVGWDKVMQAIAQIKRIEE